MKKTILFLLILLLLTVSAFAEGGEDPETESGGTPLITDEDYEGPIDSFTGEPLLTYSVEEEMEEYDRPTGLIRITETISYDTDSELYCYYFSDFAEPIRADVMDGMYTTDSVSIYLPEGVTASLTCDGEAVDEEDFDRIREPGSYVLNVTAGSMDKRVLRFTVLNELTGLVYSYRMPNGFAVTDVVHNSENDSEYTRTNVDLTMEGNYTISYLCQYTGEPYTLKLEIDHTPPELALEAVVNGVAAGPVDISDAEPGAEVIAVLDGKTVSTMNGVLTQSGSYVVSVKDRAGNETVYNFRIRVYFNFNSVIFIIVVVAVVIAIFIFMRKARKKIRVR